MLVNKTKQENGNIMVEDINNGAFFGNVNPNKCDILIISDEKGNKKMVNAHSFFIMSVDSSCDEFICEYLNKNSYYILDAEITINK